MDGDTTARLVYLSLLLLAVAGSLVTGLRQNASRTVQQMLIWGLIFAGLVGAYGLWPDLRQALTPSKAISGSGRAEIGIAEDGHFHVDTLVNGSAVTFVIDTGASGIVLTQRDAARAGIDPETLDFTGTATTANGRVSTAPVVIGTLTLGPFQDHDLRAAVNGGDLDQSLLGMDYLSGFRLSADARRMILER